MCCAQQLQQRQQQRRLLVLAQRLFSTTTLPHDAIVLLGIPVDSNSSFMLGARKAPNLVRQALYSESSNLWSESPPLHLTDHPRFVDYKDIDNVQGGIKGYEQIQNTINELLQQGARVLSLGGDHSITYPILASEYSEIYPTMTILHIDAHPDLYENFEGNPYSHASPFARIMERNCCCNTALRLVQVGIRTMNHQQREQANRFNVEVLEMDAMEKAVSVVQSIEGPMYLSLDLDGLDPAFAPGVSHHEPGGLSSRQVIDLIHQIKAQIVGADIVEYNPDRDVNGVTAMVAAKFVKEIAAKMLAASEDVG